MEEFLDNEQKKDAAKQNRNGDGDGKTEKRPELHPEYKRYFYKEHPTDKVYWVTHVPHCYGMQEISFDKKKIYSLFGDYPHALTEEERQIFDKENPDWAMLLTGKGLKERLDQINSIKKEEQNGGRDEEER